MKSTYKSRTKRWATSALIVLFVLFAGSSVGDGAEMVLDFGLVDDNPTSSTFNTTVSPRDYLGQVSGWYFGHAT